MTITINGSGTVTGANTLTNTNTVTSAAATALTLQSAGTTAVTIDTSQNVGIGTASPVENLDVRGSSTAGTKIFGVGTNANAVTLLVNSAGTQAASYNADTASVQGVLCVGAYTSGDTAYSLVARGGAIIGETTGNLLVGETAVDGSGGVAIVPSTAASGACGILAFNKGNSGGETCLRFKYQGTQVGSISYSSTATAYNTSSDYRLKEDIIPMAGALAKLALLKPCTYKWKVDGSDGQGFIAHELDEVVSGCVTGEKDAVDAEGNPVYQGIDTSFLVATLTAAIQEQQALITSLTDRITALENK